VTAAADVPVNVSCLPAPAQLVLNTRLAIPMAGLNTDLYDRCLQMRRDFERDCLPR
jgi:hypothetical protein